MYIQQAFKSKHEWWRYAIGVLVVIGAVFIGNIPFGVAIFLEEGFNVSNMTESEMLQVLDSNLSFFLLLLTFAFGLGALLLIIRFLHGQPLVEATTSRRKVDWGRVFFGFGIIAVFTLVTTVIDYNSRPEDYIWNFDFIPFMILLGVAVIMVPLQTSMEEYLFRGYLMQGFGVLARNRWVPLVLTSFIFGGLHFWNPEVNKLGSIIMFYYIGTGLLLGIMTLMDEGMELALGFHAGNNLIGALLVTADWTAFQTNSVLKDVSEPSAGADILLPLIIFYPLFLFLMAKKYKWTNWKEKLFGKVVPLKDPEILEGDSGA